MTTEQDETIATLRALNETQMHRLNSMLATQQSNDAKITQLYAELAAVKADKDRAMADISRISDELQAEAERREWCDDYKFFCRRVNELLEVGHIGPVEREFHVAHTYTVTVLGRVMASDLSAAADVADLQYGNIRETRLFSIPNDDDYDPDEPMIRPANGHLVNVRWVHQDSKAIDPTIGATS